MYKEITEESQYLTKGPCPDCSSSDACAIYDDGHTYCFSCGTHTHGDGEQVQQRERKKLPKDLLIGENIESTIRGISPVTFQHWKYTKTDDCHLANHYKDGQLVGQKVRKKGKKFQVNGKMEPLYGMWLWKEGGRKVVVTEGELDALSMSQVQGNKWPVVSLTNGAQGAKKNFQQAIEWLESFEQVVLMFDMDKPGQKAAIECAQLLTAGKAAIASLPKKDANEMLTAGLNQDLINAMWNAKPYRPDGIVTLDQIAEDALKPVEMGRSWPFETLTKLTYGRRDEDTWYIGAGTGTGKSDFLAECVRHDLTNLDLKVGVLFLEQSPVDTIRRIAGKFAGKTFHLPDTGWTTEELAASISEIQDHGKLYMYDNFGSIDWETVKSRMKYMIVGCECKHIYLDHLTALVAHADDTVKLLDSICAEIAGLAKKHKIVIHVVSHLTTPEKGSPHEEGGRVMLRHFRGSRSIGFWGHGAIGLERDQQADDPLDRNTTTVRGLKDRNSGQAVGKTFEIRYDPATGRLNELDGEDDESPFGDEDGDDF